MLEIPNTEPTIKRVLTVFEVNFSHGTILWRTTDRTDADLDLRFYERRKSDTVSKAVDAGLLSAESRLVKRIRSLGALYEDSAESCDFSS